MMTLLSASLIMFGALAFRMTSEPARVVVRVETQKGAGK